MFDALKGTSSARRVSDHVYWRSQNGVHPRDHAFKTTQRSIVCQICHSAARTGPRWWLMLWFPASPSQRKEKAICHRILRGCKILRFLIYFDPVLVILPGHPTPMIEPCFFNSAYNVAPDGFSIISEILNSPHRNFVKGNTRKNYPFLNNHQFVLRRKKSEQSEISSQWTWTSGSRHTLDWCWRSAVRASGQCIFSGIWSSRIRAKAIFMQLFGVDHAKWIGVVGYVERQPAALELDNKRCE